MSDLEAVERRVPGRFWYWIAAILFAAALLVPVPIALWNILGDSGFVVRLVAPEKKTLRLERGKHTIFSDGRGVVDGEIVISQGSISGLRVSVTSARGVNVPVEAATVATRYSTGGATGFAVLEFMIPEAGEYTIEASYREKSVNQRALLSIRKEFLGGLIGSILFAVAASLGGTFLALGIFLRTLWRRNPLFQLNRKMKFANAKAGQGQPQKPAQKYSPPGSAEGKSPVEHQYDRDK